MLQGEHSAILSTFIKLPFSTKTLFCLFLNDGLRQIVKAILSLLFCSARGVVYRAVDSLTGYQPQVTPEIKTSLSGVKHNRRIVGELAFQLDRRILEYIFSANRKKKKNARYCMHLDFHINWINSFYCGGNSLRYSADIRHLFLLIESKYHLVL